MRVRRRPLLLAVSSLAILSLVVGGFFAVHGDTHAAKGGMGTITHLTSKGSTNFKSHAGRQASETPSGNSTLEIRNEPEFDEDIAKSGHAPLRVPADKVPQPAVSSVVTDSSAPGFNGLTHADQRLAGTGTYAGTQFSLEPPDQALCVGGGKVMESVNTALIVYNTSGTALTAPVAINEFYGLTPEIDRVNLVFGDFSSDPKCYFDPDTGRWFISILQADVDPASGDFSGRTSVLLAVSKTGDPTGDYFIYKIDTTDDGNNGTQNHAGCPCLGDQPLIGADATGFYVSTNEFPLFSDGFFGAQVYAMSKTALTSGVANPTVVHINAGDTSAFPTPDAGGIWYSIQPATTPAGGSYESANNGTEYFMSSLQFGPGALDNRIAVWAMTNTASLTSGSPSVSLSNVVIDSEIYGQPPDSAQKDGPRFLAENMELAAGVSSTPEEKLGFLAGNDDRMNQVVYAGGKLWSGVNTVIASNGPTRVGIAYFIVTPSDPHGTLSASMANQGYVALKQNDVLFPSIGVNAAGKGVMTFTVAGPDYFPSAGYAKIDATNGAGAVHVAAAGAGPEDGFTAYTAFGGDGTARWGDYSAAVADENGDVWFACEYIPNLPRTILANWGTFVGKVTP